MLPDASAVKSARECLSMTLTGVLHVKRKRSDGSRPLPQRTVLSGILSQCRSGCHWAMLPACHGSKSTVHEHFQHGNKAGVMTEIFRILLAEYGEKSALMPSGRPWTALCRKLRRAFKKSAMEGPGRNPTDSGRSGSKIHLHVDGQGIPLGVTARFRRSTKFGPGTANAARSTH